MSYQYWLAKTLASLGVELQFRNLGMGGAVSASIAQQVPRAIPTDLLIIMGGTNDCWLYSSQSDHIQNQECQTEVVSQLGLAIQMGLEGGAEHVILCTIPPIRVNMDASWQMYANILEINKRLKRLAFDKSIPLCDVHGAMANSQNEIRDGLVEYDGVHFTLDGNKACGYAIGNCILELMNMKKK
jgi:lysophospholipase L1-like esterase